MKGRVVISDGREAVADFIGGGGVPGRKQFSTTSSYNVIWIVFHEHVIITRVAMLYFCKKVINKRQLPCDKKVYALITARYFHV